jgi:pimeloyl-ACP methyl ester carboxylesterase
LPVPLDPAAPGGEKVQLALARVPAKKPAQRIGSLVINPGGPGAPGTQFVQTVENQLPAAITDRFDIVGWDPRGTGRSSPVDCGKRLDYLFDVDTAPDDPAELAALEAASQRFADTCNERSGELLRHISSSDTVHDLDLIRAALGDEKLTYAGFSYGTYLGALYAQAYPNKVRALLLDGAVDPSVSIDELSIQQAKGFEASLKAFLDDCAQRESCEFHHNGDPAAALYKLRARIDKNPMRTDDGRVFGPSQLDIALAAPLYSGASGYRVLASGLASAENGDPSKLLSLFDDYMFRDPDGTYATEWPAFLAISCADGPAINVPKAESLQAEAGRQAPIFGASNVGLSFPCAYWPFPPVNPVAAPISAPGAPPIVVVGTTGDPATPIAWADGLARQLDASLITVDGTTHTSSLDGNPCLDGAMTAYLIRLQPPEAGLRCGA